MNTDISAITNLKYCSLEWIEDGIVLMKIKDEVIIDKEAAILITDAVVAFAEHKPFKIIADTQDIIGTITSEGRVVFSTAPEYNRLRLKSVFIVNSLAIRLLVNFYQKVNLKQQNTKTFSSLSKGVAWITKD